MLEVLKHVYGVIMIIVGSIDIIMLSINIPLKTLSCDISIINTVVMTI